MQLGKLLLHLGIATADQVEAALRQQVVYGGRLGTNLIELGYATPDQIAQALGRQHHVPAALERHLSQHDRKAITMIPREVAATHGALPLAFSMSDGKRLVVCFRDPHKTASARAIARIAQMQVVPTAISELSLYYWLELCYGIQRSRRFAHARAGRSEPLPRRPSDVHQVVTPDDDDFSIDVDLDDEVVGMPDQLQLVQLDHSDVEKNTNIYQHDTRHHSSLLELAELARQAEAAEEAARPAEPEPEPEPEPVPAPNPSRASAPAIVISPPPVDPSAIAAAAAAAAKAASKFVPKPEPEPEPEPPTLDAEGALAAIAEADGRDQVLEATLAFMRLHFGAGLIAIAKESLALGSKGFGGSFDSSTVESIVVPLNLPSCFKTAHDDARPFRGVPPEDGHTVQNRFFKLFDIGTPAEVVVMPVKVRSRVVCLLYAHAKGGGALSNESVEQLTAVADATSEAFVRLIRGAKQKS